MLEAYLNETIARESITTRAISESRGALESIRSLQSDEISQLLVQIGGGLFLRTTAQPPDTIIVNIGADVAIDKSKEKAIEFLNDKIKDLEKALSELGSQKSELTNRIDVNRAAISSMIQKQKG